MIKVLKKYNTFLIFICGYIQIFIIHNFIFLTGDDFYYATFSSSLTNFIEKHINHYLEVNGRAIIHFLDTIFLIFDVHLWKFINPLIVLFTLLLISKIVNKKEAFLIAVILFFTFDIEIVQFPIYWVTGTFNYLFPMLLLLSSYYLYQKNLYTNFRKNKFLYYILLFISGASMEQTGLMLFGLFFLETFNSCLILKEKITKMRVFSLIVTLVGYLTVVFSPGTFERMRLQGIGTEPNNLVNNCLYLLKLFFFNKTMVLIHIILILSCFFFWREKGKKKLCFLIILLLSAYLIFSNIIIKGYRNYFKGLYIVLIIFYLILLFYTYLIRYKENPKDISNLSFIIVACGGILMITVSNVFGGRILFASLLCLMIPAIRGLIAHKEHNILFIFIIGALLSYITLYKLILIVLFIVYKLFKKSLKHEFIMLTVFSLICFKNIYIGYSENYNCFKYNITLIEEAKTENSRVLHQKEMPYTDYGVSFIERSPYHVKWFKIYYGLNEDIEIIFDD